MKNYLLKEFEFFNSITDWKWSSAIDNSQDWVNKYKKVKEYVAKYKCIPSQHSKTVSARKLGLWCVRQRAKYKSLLGNSIGRLSNEQIQKLEAIAGWYWEKDFDTRWMTTLNSVLAFVAKNKYIPSAKSKDLAERKLGHWCSWQRANFKNPGKGGIRPLSNEQKKELEAIPHWYWTKK